MKPNSKSLCLSILFGLLLFAGCQSTGGFGSGLTEMVVNSLFDTDVDEHTRENRQHWKEATNGAWDGVDPKFDN